ncbi:hypothetical protein G6F40_017642 [Rhizopus arrhizus]|nr:hypothetical protein G6F40_017642 [Rhizopus arrhizus]
MMGSSPSRMARNVAAAIAGAVFRAKGSRITSASLMPSSRVCSAAMYWWASLHTSIGLAWALAEPRRSSVFCNRLRASVKRMNCLGSSSRDNGHRRDPEPPQRMTAR